MDSLHINSKYLINNGHIEAKSIYDATKGRRLKEVDGIMHDCLH